MRYFATISLLKIYHSIETTCNGKILYIKYNVKECINNDNTIFSYVLEYKDIILNKRKFKMKVEEVFCEISQDIKNPTR